MRVVVVDGRYALQETLTFAPDDSGPGGIYLDEGSAFIEITGNSVYRVPTPMNYNNRAQDRIKTCREHDSFFNVQPPPQQVVEQAEQHRGGSSRQEAIGVE